MAKNKKVPWNVLVQEERAESSHLNEQNEENPFAATTQRKFDGREDDDRYRARVDERRINSRDAEERLIHLNRNSMEDVLYLHPNDHASIQLVGAPLTGASSHICCNAKLMKSVEKLCTPQRIFLPDGSMQWIYFSGTAYLNSDVLLERVLLVPTFTHNLISVAQLAMDLSVKCTFLDTHCLIQKKLDDHIVGVGKSFGKLYIMSSKDYSQISDDTHPKELTAADWHCLLGHVSISIMKHIPAVKDLCTKDACNQIADCEVCHKFEQSRNKFPLLQRRTDRPFLLVHTDIWGPYHAANISNTCYVLTLVDDYSRITWTYLLSSKEQVYGVLKSFIHLIKTQFGADIMQIKSDSGSEFISANVKELFAAAGIMYQRTFGYKSQQSGVVEKKYQTLLQVARTLMSQSKLPIRFWPQSILAATWIINRMPHCLLDWQSPYSLLFGQTVCLDQLKPFGSLAYVPNLDSQREKVDSRSITCVMLGVAQNQKGYILYDMEGQKIFTSRNIHCFETVFPFAQSGSFSIPSTNISTVPPAVISDSAPYVHDSSVIDSARIASPLPTNSVVSSIPISIDLPLDDDGSSSAHFVSAADDPSWLTDFIDNHIHHSFSFIPSEVQFSTPIVLPSIIVLHSINSFLNMAYIKAHTPYFDVCRLVGWLEPMNKELDAVKQNGTWIVTPSSIVEVFSSVEKLSVVRWCLQMDFSILCIFLILYSLLIFKKSSQDGAR